MKKIFLKAEWNNLVMANYHIDPSLLQSYLPSKTELDFFNGQTYVSLIGFMFQDVKVLGIKIPWHINFEEVNLRFYVKHKENNQWKRGVVFIKEIVPKQAITYVANNFYHEKYSTLRMKHYRQEQAQELVTGYEWKFCDRWNKIEATTKKEMKQMITGSEEEFIAEHYFGYSRYNSSKTFEYEISHPRWSVYPVTSYHIDCDFSGLYGDRFSFLARVKPNSVFMANGSAITISNKRKI
ncbi:MAG: DUF2071 domain-containing protein [Chitinophagaceae bacterium]|nr:DUF2071 domain-containing protein [Chitinophagaceae bacterium]